MSETITIITLVTAVLSLGATIYVGLFRVARLDARMEIVWGFIMRQGVASSILGGLVERNSPLRLSVKAIERHSELIARLKEWYTEPLQKLSDLDLFVALEKQFNKEFTMVCEEEKVLPGGCTAAAMFLLRPSAYKDYETNEWK